MEKIASLSSEEIAEIEAEASHYANKQAASIEALKIVQEHRGWVSDESIKEVAELLEMSASELDGVATFYNLIFRQPVGENVIMLCDSVSCWIMGHDRIADAIKQHLGIEYGETTVDGKYTLLPVTCQGACDRAPVMLVNGELKTHLDEHRIIEILDKSE